MADAPVTSESSHQAVGALAIVAGLTVIAAGSMAVAWKDPAMAPEALALTTTIVGGLIGQLNMPTGISNVIANVLASVGKSTLPKEPPP